MQSGKNGNGVLFVAVALAVALGFAASIRDLEDRPSAGNAKLVAIEELPDTGEMCPPEPQSTLTDRSRPADDSLFAMFEETAAHAAGEGIGDTAEVTRPPVRTIRDTYPIYSSIAVDPQFNEVILQDTNLFGIKVFNRLDNTPADAEFTEPKRVIEGSKTDLEYNNGLYVDPQTGDIYSVASDTADNMIVFSHGAQGDVAPMRKLRTPHRNFATAVDEEKGEVFITIQYPPKVVVYRKQASDNEKPLRVLEGEHTGLYDAHGIAIDVQKKLLFVSNWGNASDYKVAGSGKFYPPSITVYPLDANGDTAPLRVIQGHKTQLDWAGGMALDPERGELYVSDDLGHSILVFRENDNGNVSPARALKGPKTGLKNPTGVAIDSKNKELWVSNLGNSSGTCYSLTASGNTPPSHDTECACGQIFCEIRQTPVRGI